QADVAAATELVDLDEPRAQVGALGQILLFQRRDLPAGIGHRLLHRLDLAIGVVQRIGLQLAVDLELAEVAEERALLRGELIGLALEGLQPRRRARRLRFGARPLRLRRGDRGEQRPEGEGEEEERDAGGGPRRRRERRPRRRRKREQRRRSEREQRRRREREQR